MSVRISDKAISPLRRRMVEDMTIRNLSPMTQRSYLHAVEGYSRHFGRNAGSGRPALRLCAPIARGQAAQIVRPPSTSRTTPVMNSASSDAR